MAVYGRNRRGRARRRVPARARFLGIAVAVLVIAVVSICIAVPRRDVRTQTPEQPTPTVTQSSTPTSVPSATPVPTQAPAYLRLEARPVEQTRPDGAAWKYRRELFVDGKSAGESLDSESICFSDDYAQLPAVATFRGGNLRHNAAYGTATLEKKRFRILWRKRIGSIDSGYAKWTGVGWTGQPVLVRWPEPMRLAMNLKEEFRRKADLVEVIYGTLDGNIYFLDAHTGEATRDPIRLGFPIKGSVSIDPRGYPLLYVGQGISKANGKTGKIGWRIYSLLDQRELFFLNGRDSLCLRKHGSFDGACLVDAASDTVLLGGENGLFYRIRLNTKFDIDLPGISVHPQVTTYRYRSAASPELGIENSVTAYGKCAWFADNSGLLTCLDLDAMAPAWLFYNGDDTDATIAVDPEEDGRLALYTVNQIDRRGSAGRCTVRRIDALTGMPEWSYSLDCTSDGTNGGGGFASPAVGANEYRDFVYFNVCRTSGGSGVLICFDKQTGKAVWTRSTGSPCWSSPVLVYRPDGTGVLVQCTPGKLHMFDPATGKTLSEVEVEGKIEASPAVFEDILVVGTRSQYIYGVRLT